MSELNKGTHKFGFIDRVISEGKLHRDKYWDGNTMTVEMPNPDMGIRLTRYNETRSYAIEGVSDVAKAALKNLGLEAGVTNYDVAQVRKTLSDVRNLRSNVMHQEQERASGQQQRGFGVA